MECLELRLMVDTPMNRFKITIKESFDPIEATSNVSGLSLFVFQNKDGISLIFYKTSRNFKKTGRVTVIGAIDLVKTFKPCIPDTLEVSTVYVVEQYRKKGYGSMLYSIAFYYAGARNHGLTSDHSSGTSDDARKIWDKIGNSPAFSKRATADGNDEFDYDGSTPDQFDDCDDAYGEPVGVDHSLILKDINALTPAFNKLVDSHDRNLTFIDNPDVFKSNLEQEAFKAFGKAYDG